MDQSIAHAWRLVKDVYGYHKRFSSFQKIVITSLLVGFSSIFYTRLLTVVFVYVVAVISSVIACHVLTSVQTNFTFGVSILLFVTKYEHIFKEIFKIVQFLQIKDEQQNEASNGRLEACPSGTSNGADEFHDAMEHDEEKIEAAERILAISHGNEENVDKVYLYVADNVTHPGHQDNENEERTNDTKTSDDTGSTSTVCSWRDEVQLFSCLVSKDFVKSWYDTFSSANDAVVEEVHSTILSCFVELCGRFQKLDMYQLCTDVLVHYRQHLRTFQTARTLYKTQPRRRLSQRRLSSSQQLYASRRINSVEDAFEIKFTYHSAVWGAENEIIYFRSVVQILLSQLLSDHLHLCDSSYLLLVEILTCNIFLPVIELLSDSDFLYECIIKILSDEEMSFSFEDEEGTGNQIDTNVELARVSEQQNTQQHESDLKLCDRQKNTEETEYVDVNKCHTSDKLYIGSQSPRGIRRSSSAYDKQQLKILQHDMSKLREKNYDEYDIHDNSLLSVGNGDHSLYCDRGSSEMARSCPSDLGGVTGTAESDGRDCGDCSGESSTTDEEDVQPTVQIFLDSDEVETDQLDSLELPNMLFVDVSITETETRQELRSSTQYTLYNIQFDALYNTQSNSLELRTKDVKRRFREFVNLQARLEDNYAYKKSLKDIKGPKRWLSLPFGNMDKRSVDSRRKSLETFLKSLIQRLDICNGPELKEFLAYEGDSHIAFVRKAPEMSVPRIDKMFVKTMSDVFDKIGELSNKAQEVLPRLPGKKDNPVQEYEDKPVKDFDQINVTFCTENQVSAFQGKLKKYTEKLGDCADMRTSTPTNPDNMHAMGCGTPAMGGDVTPTADLPYSDQVLAHHDDVWDTQSTTAFLSPDTSAYEATEFLTDQESPSGSESENLPAASITLQIPSSKKTDVENVLLEKSDIADDTDVRVSDINDVQEEDPVTSETGKVTTEGDAGETGHLSPKATREADDCIALAEAVIGLAIQILQGRDSWVSRDRVVSLTKHLAGTALHRFLMMKLDTVTSEEMCVFYIRTLRETVWPGGKLSMDGRKVKTDKQKTATKDQARKCLAEFFPDILRQLVGSEDYLFGMDEVIESVEHQKLNRNFIFTFMDHLVEKLFPEVSSQVCQQDILK